MDAGGIIAGVPIYNVWDGFWNKFKDTRCTVTGACGSIGSVLFRKLSDAGARVLGVDHDEYAVAQNHHIILSDYEDIPLHRIEYVFHCAAYKHLTLGNLNHWAFKDNNYEKVKRWLQANSTWDGRFILASTDKVTGKSIMGQTKRLAEEYVLEKGHTAVRMVNVAYSRGSVLDIWQHHGSVKALCPPHVVRYWMQAEDAAYAMAWSALKQPGLYVVNSAPKFTMGEIRDAWVHRFDPRKTILWREQPLAANEAEDEQLYQPHEVVLQEGELARVGGKREEKE